MSIVKAKPDASGSFLSDHRREASAHTPRPAGEAAERGQALFRYPCFRHLMPGVLLLALGLAIAFVGSHVIQNGFGVGPASSWLCSAMIMTVAAACVVYGLYLANNGLIVEAKPEGVSITRQVLGVPFRQFVPVDAIMDVKLTTKVERSHEQVIGVSCRLSLVTSDGKHIGVGDGLNDSARARAIQRHMIQGLGPGWSRCLPGDPRHHFRNSHSSTAGTLFLLFKLLVVFTFLYDILIP